jgi:hypothetical protein
MSANRQTGQTIFNFSVGVRRSGVSAERRARVWWHLSQRD